MTSESFHSPFKAASSPLVKICAVPQLAGFYAPKSRTMHRSLHADPPNAKYCRSI